MSYEIEKVILGKTSLPSRTVTVIDIPEPQNIECEFFYNFFVRNESISSDGTSIFIDPATTNSYERKFLQQTRKYPRFVRVSWEKPEFSTQIKDLGFKPPGTPKFETSPDELDLLVGNEISIKKNMKNLLFEEAITNGSFSAIHLKDTDMDEKLYKLTEGSLERFSPQNLWIVAGNDAGNNSSFLQSSFVDPSTPLSEKTTQALAHMSPAGITLIDNDNKQIADESFFGPKSIEVSFSANNLFVGSLIRGSSEGATGLFAEELRQFNSKASQAQVAAVKNSSPGTVSYDDYVHSIKPVSVFGPLPPTETESGKKYDERSVIAGYLIEKTEINSKGETVYHDPIIVENAESTSFLDTSVRYGAIYHYKIRCVALTQFEALQIDHHGKKSTGVYVARVLIASRGTISVVHCEERVPPNPPDEIEFVYDYNKNNLMFSWGFPLNPQRDIKKFQVFRRRSIFDPFTLLAQYDFDDSITKYSSGEVVPTNVIKKMRSGLTFYIDEEFHKDKQVSFIYSACAIDAHGYSSNYSEQFLVSFDLFKNKLVINRISPPGAPKPYPNLYILEDLFQDAIKTSSKDRVAVFLDPECYDLYDEDGNDLNILSRDGENPSYFMTILNTDWQQSKIVEIHISEKEKIEAESTISTRSSAKSSIQTLPLEGSTGASFDTPMVVEESPKDWIDKLGGTATLSKIGSKKFGF